jgi:DNA-binding NtrC family response regulator
MQTSTVTAKRLAQILLVEDEPSLRSAAAEYLTMRGHNVLSAGSVAEAIALWDIHSETIELLISDVKMPGMSGTHLAALLTELKPRLRVIFETAHVNAGVASVLTNNENARLIEKPYLLEELVQAVRALLGSGSPATG